MLIIDQCLLSPFGFSEMQFVQPSDLCCASEAVKLAACRADTVSLFSAQRLCMFLKKSAVPSLLHVLLHNPLSLPAWHAMLHEL